MWQFYAEKAVGKLNKCFDQPAGQPAQRFYQAVQSPPIGTDDSCIASESSVEPLSPDPDSLPIF
jgi:hypothetical protein